MMGTGHYYFDEMRSSLKLGSKSAFWRSRNSIFTNKTVKISVTAAAVQKKGT
jgi:hypothetical protein